MVYTGLLLLLAHLMHECGVCVCPSEPENDNFVATVLEIRADLGWINELPRHGPGSRKAMDALQDKPDPDTDLEVLSHWPPTQVNTLYSMPHMYT